MIRQKTAMHLIIGITIITAVCLTMFLNWEANVETWGYWYFARVFAETGDFIVPDRSPFYILYLNLFNWMPYPASVTTEYLVTTSITVTALVVFFRSYFGVWLALLAACLWIPYLQMSQAPVQKLALACSLIAVLLRNDKADRFHLVASYTFLILAYFFRQTYMLLIVAFLAYDALRTMRKSGIRPLFHWRLRLASDWPLLIVSILFLWFLACQSSSLWNNVWYTNTEWFPVDGKIHADAGIQPLNVRYIELKYGTFEGHDFYFTNREAFGGATSVQGALLANPQLFLEIVILNLKDLVPTIMETIWIPKIEIGFMSYLLYIFKLILLIGIIYGAFRAARNGPTKTLVISSIALLVAIPTAIAIPQPRYMFPLVPIFVMAVSWYGAILTVFLQKLYPSDETLLKKMALFIFAGGIFSSSLLFYSIAYVSTKPLRGIIFLAGAIFAFLSAALLFTAARFPKARFRIAMSRFALALPTIVLLIIFSQINVLGWADIVRNAINDVGRGRLHLLEQRDGSLKAAMPALTTIIQGCRGIMSYESTFLGAFLNIPQSRVYAISEIPPFGQLGQSVYNGLNPDRIDCVIVDTNLTSREGCGTTIQSRYQNYIRPYVDQLTSYGAIRYDIPSYGYAIVLQNQRKSNGL
ncbi:MAG: hypothetical protein WCQ90_02505 [Deltaproteobacteria bacterium]